MSLFLDKLIGGKADPADTVRRNAVGVLDQTGTVRLGSLHRFFTINISLCFWEFYHQLYLSESNAKIILQCGGAMIYSYVKRGK